MNRLQAMMARSEYTPEDHLVIAVDGVPLDVLLDRVDPEHRFLGLVPSLLGWFHNDGDAKLVWQRILPPVGCSSFAPLLICPDDLDLSCSVVMAEVAAEADLVTWARFGWDASPGQAPCTAVRWLSGLGPYRFSRDDYGRCLETFREASA